MTDDKELQYQARIRELREALAYWIPSDRHFSCSIAEAIAFDKHSELLSRSSDDLSALDDYVREEKRKVLVRAMTACHFEKEDYLNTKHPKDWPHNIAVDNCIKAIETLAEELK